MAQQKLNVKSKGNNKNKKVSKVGLHKKIGAKKATSASEITKRKINTLMEVGIKKKIEDEMKAKVKKNNGKLSILKSDGPVKAPKKLNH